MPPPYGVNQASVWDTPPRDFMDYGRLAQLARASRLHREGRGEKCLGHFARRLSVESYAFKREIAGPPEVGRAHQ